MADMRAFVFIRVDKKKLGAFAEFAHIADAFAYLEQGQAKGKVVVQMVVQESVERNATL